ncbi:MAG TPA: alpha-glucuronidase family glycosyl hydrolase [Polyangiaceae bacterium]|nr:alpha-glucuronidase family glycosyl hydrolase [Polyangiaceae bacterium]
MKLSDLPEDDGYRLWLRYEPLSEPLFSSRRALARELVFPGEAPTLVAARDELVRGLGGLLGGPVPLGETVHRAGTVLAGTPDSSPDVRSLGLEADLRELGSEGFVVRSARLRNEAVTVIAARTDIGVLYGAFHFLRLLQTGASLDALDLRSAPRIRRRLLDHWDNLDRTVERGYAGFSLWDWQKLPGYVSPRMRDYARANASIGINGTVLTNVNANAVVLTREWLEKVAALADTFRPYGVRVYLTARFNAPVELGALSTADPDDARVRAWWAEKAREIYRLIPDFGGFLVKASSEGQPGPQSFGRSHADGANLLADAVGPHGGIVMWRAFVYASEVPTDRAKQAYDEFVPLDGTFRENVLVQVKNGPIDFQPREPFHPLFGAMPKTPVMTEFQLTQEYLGFATHLVYLGTLFEECLDSDTYARGPGSLVASVTDGSLHGHALSGIAAVANIGTDRNWCGHPFAQANWYAFGRLAWDHRLRADAIAREWLAQTFSRDPSFVEQALSLMLESREACVDYMTPLGLHHLMAWDHHHGPGPWIDQGRPDWTSVYFHRADERGLGFDRTGSGSNALEQYRPEVAARCARLGNCPEELLLWFHHVPWDHRMRSGRTLWDELCHRYHSGVLWVARARSVWDELAPFVDSMRFEEVRSLLRIQESEAVWWRDACLSYFQTYSRKPFPEGIPAPARALEEYRAIDEKYVPGI